MAGGRPATTVHNLIDDWEEKIKEAAQGGASDAELRCILGLGKSAWYTLLETSSQFREAINICHELSEVWWERTGRSMASGGHVGNATVWVFNMKNRFGWHDKQQLDHTSSDGTMSPKRIELVAPTVVNNDHIED